jgi:hypothetical protein
VSRHPYADRTFRREVWIDAMPGRFGCDEVGDGYDVHVTETSLGKVVSDGYWSESWCRCVVCDCLRDPDDCADVDNQTVESRALTTIATCRDCDAEPWVMVARTLAAEPTCDACGQRDLDGMVSDADGNGFCQACLDDEYQRAARMYAPRKMVASCPAASA